jgi:hypothetical protein
MTARYTALKQLPIYSTLNLGQNVLPNYQYLTKWRHDPGTKVRTFAVNTSDLTEQKVSQLVISDYTASKSTVLHIHTINFKSFFFMETIPMCYELIK